MTKKLAKNIVSFERIGNKYAIAKVTNNIFCDWKVLEKKRLTDNDPAMFCAVKGKKIIKDNAVYWKSKRLGHSRKYCFEYIQYLLGKTKIEPEYNPDTKHLSNKFKY
jgi:hypothetical protein|tara:strand:+ start:841 stop:1161 length:321 start_codon:yes stop_codon:yes gene_type:complete